MLWFASNILCLLVAAAFTAACVRVYRNYRSTRLAPARYMVFSFGLSALIALTYLLHLWGIRRVPDFTGTPFCVISTAVYMVGMGAATVLLTLFTREAFRPRARWATALFALVSLLAGAGGLIPMLTHGLEMDIHTVMRKPPWWQIALLPAGALLGFGWMAYEGFSNHRRLKAAYLSAKKLDPYVIHRFYLFGLAGLAYVGLAASGPGLLGVVAPYGDTQIARFEAAMADLETTKITMTELEFARAFDQAMRQAPLSLFAFFYLQGLWHPLFAFACYFAWGASPKYQERVRARYIRLLGNRSFDDGERKRAWS